MRARRRSGLVLAIAIGVAAACTRSSAPGENATSTTLPPILVCYEPDGAPCPPLDAGEEAGADDAGDAAADH